MITMDSTEKMPGQPGMAIIAVGLLLMATGCSSSGNTAALTDDVETLNDWKKIIEVREQGVNRVRQHVGYLNRQYSETDPEGVVFVLDVRRNKLGFVLPTGRAYAFEIRRQELEDKKDLGKLGFESGVRNLLGLPVSATLEYEPIVEAPLGPTPASS